jgi:hypothetical protein
LDSGSPEANRYLFVLGDAYTESKAGATIDARKSSEIFGFGTKMAGGMKKLLCNFYMHVASGNQ